jgi:hypothetical protein
MLTRGFLFFLGWVFFFDFSRRSLFAPLQIAFSGIQNTTYHPILVQTYQLSHALTLQIVCCVFGDPARALQHSILLVGEVTGSGRPYAWTKILSRKIHRR